MPGDACPDPGRCPVPDTGDVDLRRLRTVPLPGGDEWCTAYRRNHWPALFNASGLGNTRFAPLLDAADDPIPTVYVARRATVALLESAFHEVSPTGTRTVSLPVDIAPRGLATVRIPDGGVRLVDLTDDGLARLGMTRSQLTATGPEHYSCTRPWAAALHGRRVGASEPVGLIWESRIAEVVAGGMRPVTRDLFGTVETRHVAVVFGDLAGTDPAAWHATVVHGDMTSGAGRLLIDDVADQLEATIIDA